MKRMAVVLTGLLCVAGCASTGNRIDKAQVDQIKKGATTRSQVEAEFGPPVGGVSIMGNGDREARYMYTESQAKAFSFIPYVGVFMGGMRNRIQTLVIVYDQNNIVKDYDFTDASGDNSGGSFNSHNNWTTTPAGGK